VHFFGFSLWHDLLTGSVPWLQSLALGSPDEFDPAKNGWEKVFGALRGVLAGGLGGKLGGCFHASSKVPAIFEQFDLLPSHWTARDAFAAKFPLELGILASFDPPDLPLAGRYPEVLGRDIDLCALWGGVTIVSHAPKELEGSIAPLVDELTSDAVITALDGTRITLCWENLGPTEFFGSLRHLVELREAIADRLQEIGRQALVTRHLFCFDTGHLLVWRHQHPLGAGVAQQEIDEELPAFARFIKVFHIHANDGRSDEHLVPHSLELFDHPSRAGVNPDHFLQYSDLVVEWLQVCENYQGVDGQHVHLEALHLPFTLNQIVQFGKILGDNLNF